MIIFWNANESNANFHSESTQNIFKGFWFRTQRDEASTSDPADDWKQMWHEKSLDFQTLNTQIFSVEKLKAQISEAELCN